MKVDDVPVRNDVELTSVTNLFIITRGCTPDKLSEFSDEDPRRCSKHSVSDDRPPARGADFCPAERSGIKTSDSARFRGCWALLRQPSRRAVHQPFAALHNALSVLSSHLLRLSSHELSTCRRVAGPNTSKVH